MENLLGFGEVGEVFVEGFETGVGGAEDFFERGGVGALVDFGFFGEEKGNFEGHFMGVSAVEDAVDFGGEEFIV